MRAFNEEFYLHQYPDIAKAIRRGEYPNGYVHWKKLGYRQRRQVRWMDAPKSSPTLSDEAVERPTAILLTGGIGDIFAVEAMMSDQLRGDLTSIYYATPVQKAVMPLFKLLPNFPNLRNHIVLWDDFSYYQALLSKGALTQLKNTKQPGWERLLPDRWSTVLDFSITNMFNSPTSRSGESSFMQHRLCNVDHFDLPSEFVVVVSSTSRDKSLPRRELSVREWQRLVCYLEDIGMPAVILNGPGVPKCSTEGFLDLSGDTSLAESIEVLKLAKGYIGVDSCLSVMAAILFDPPWLWVRGRSKNLNACKHFYYFKKRRFHFFVPELFA